HPCRPSSCLCSWHGFARKGNVRNPNLLPFPVLTLTTLRRQVNSPPSRKVVMLRFLVSLNHRTPPATSAVPLLLHQSSLTSPTHFVSAERSALSAEMRRTLTKLRQHQVSPAIDRSLKNS